MTSLLKSETLVLDTPPRPPPKIKYNRSAKSKARDDDELDLFFKQEDSSDAEPTILAMETPVKKKRRKSD